LTSLGQSSLFSKISFIAIDNLGLGPTCLHSCFPPLSLTLSYAFSLFLSSLCAKLSYVYSLSPKTILCFSLSLSLCLSLSLSLSLLFVCVKLSYAFSLSLSLSLSLSPSLLRYLMFSLSLALSPFFSFSLIFFYL
jgi:hypothetical protein